LAKEFLIMRFVSLFYSFFFEKKKNFFFLGITGETTNMDAEKKMLHLLRSECGQAFTKNLDAMFIDVNESQVMNEEFLTV
jgi:hypothetical protein